MTADIIEYMIAIIATTITKYNNQPVSRIISTVLIKKAIPIIKKTIPDCL